MTLEQTFILTYNLPTSHAEKSFIRTWMELVAPDERPWNQALYVSLARPQQAQDQAAKHREYVLFLAKIDAQTARTKSVITRF